ncbi:pyridoxal phosphate-dependent aminotransferase [Roseisolibacter sp. H3M3-2]|uniref:pyridoxal phosphate-dependent aminotransferase n=1 Tax=Roseisolibacter sp. H3M3-2 TaxID=3031323 RepID=UPI0023DB459E|nr:pyridoxal phosphate-dependent aminotransferase [Roseisolibacter sp. H3M3-2]MDF1503592.1 pyridoxal phosphate-dependent aminotransferase [Roseisolibacter sp. H3M3-2]
MSSHVLDHLSLGKIVQIRERLLQAQAAGRTVYRFESGDPSFAPAPHVVAAIADAAARGQTHYPPNSGIPALRAAIGRKLERVNGIALPDDDCAYVTNGSMHGLFVTFTALLDAGDEVILPDPMWTEVAENVRLAGGVAVGVPLRAADGFAYDPDAIARAVTLRTKAIFVNTPHNPTGAVSDRERLLAILRLADERGLWVVSDEAYEDVIYAPHRHHSLLALAQRHVPGVADRMVSLWSFSKSHAMSGLRVGYTVTTAAALRDRIPKVLRCSINGVNSVAQWAATAALEGPRDHLDAMRAEYALRRDLMLEALTGIDGVRPFAPGGGFYLWCELDPSVYARLGVRDADELSGRLAEAGIGSAPGDAFGHQCKDAIRFAYSCATEMVRGGAPAARGALLGGSVPAAAPAALPSRPPSATRAPGCASRSCR